MTIIDANTYDTIKQINLDDELRFTTIDSTKNLAFGINSISKDIFWYDIQVDMTNYLIFSNKTTIKGTPVFDNKNNNLLIINSEESQLIWVTLDKLTNDILKTTQLPKDFRPTVTNLELQNFYSINELNNELTIYDPYDLNITKSIELQDIPFHNVVGVYLNEKVNRLLIEYQNILQIIDIENNNIIASIDIFGPQRMTFTNNNKISVVNHYDSNLFGTTFGKMISIDLESGKILYEIDTNLGTNYINFYKNTNEIYVSNSISDSISIINDENKELVLTYDSHRFQIGIGLLCSILFAVLFIIETNPISKRMSVGSI